MDWALTSIDETLIRTRHRDVNAGERAVTIVMMASDNQYAAFLADFAAGKLSPGELLAVRLHFALSDRGAHNRSVLEATGGMLLERGDPVDVHGAPRAPEREIASEAPARAGETDWVDYYSRHDVMDRRWRTSVFGVKTLPTHLMTASLLRLDPGERAPRHSHASPDVTVVLHGAFADDEGEYHRGDLAFADAGDRHAPATVGDETCVCLIATPEGRPTVDLRALLSGWLKKKGPRQ